MTSHASLIPAIFHRHRSASGWLIASRAHAFIIPPMLIVMAVCFWFATTGDGHLFYREYFCGFYDAQARSILHLHLDVPPKAIGFEAFDHNGKTYGYFGITPALLRIPLVIAFPNMDGRWSRMMMLIACGINLVCAYRLILRLQRFHPIETNVGKVIAALFILCAGIGSTTVFLVSRTYVYHEAIMWGATFALLFVDRLLTYLTSPSWGVLAATGACAFLSFHARATAGAGALLAMCILMLCLIDRAIRARTGSIPGGAALPTIPASRAGVVRDADPTKSRTRHGANPPGIDVARDGWFGLNYVERPGLHALVALLAITLTVGTYFGINYAKFATFQGVPVQFYRMYAINPQRVKITGGRQFHLENIPTGIASYFCGNGVSFGPEFPWVYMTERARVLGHPALDVVEPYSGIPVSMPALFLLALAGLQPTFRGATSESRRLRLPAITLLLGGGVVLATVGITERYLHDFYPWLIVLASAGISRLMNSGHQRAKVAVVASLTMASIALNCAFAIYFQREYVWGEPDAKRAEWVSARQVINRVLHRPPPPPVTEQP